MGISRFDASSATTMSAPRQTGIWRAVLTALLFLAGSLEASPSGPVVADPKTGLAINGFDPVAYFTEAAARQGRVDTEYRLSGATWRFRNDGNRAAFADNPEVYAPQFGGYDPVAIARGTSVPGHPQVWLVTGQRLYLFYSKEARAEFASQAQSLLSLAERRWPEVQRSLP
jgi:hypothetical protein